MKFRKKVIRLLAFIVITIIVLFNLTRHVIVPFLEQRGQLILLNGNELGNILCRYSIAAAIRFRQGQSFHPWIISTKTLDPFVKMIPTRMDFQPNFSVHQNIQKQLQYLPEHVVSLKNEYDEWEDPTGVLRAVQPLIQKMILTMGGPTWGASPPYPRYPTSNEKTAIFTERGGYGGTASPPIAGPPITISIHFRCSDSPINRHPDYPFVKWTWFKYILETRFEFTINIRVMSCTHHRSSSSVCNIYAQDFVQYLRTELNPRPSSVSLHCGSLAQDFMEMVQTPFLISSGSSMSSMAAFGRKPNTTILPSFLINGYYYPGILHVNVKDSNYILPHEQVIDYFDTFTVCKQLRSVG